VSEGEVPIEAELAPGSWHSRWLRYFYFLVVSIDGAHLYLRISIVSFLKKKYLNNIFLFLILSYQNNLKIKKIKILKNLSLFSVYVCMWTRAVTLPDKSQARSDE
jgi:hypothetical protein